MPTIPDASNLGGRPVPQTSRGIVGVRAGQAEQGAIEAARTEGQAALAITGAAGRAAGEAFNLFAQEQDRLNKMKVADAETQLVNSITNMTVGESGYQRDKLGAVLTPEYLTKHNEAYNAAMRNIEGTLSTPAQKRAFREAADQHKSNFMKGVMTHAINETEAYEEVTYKAQIESQKNYAKAQYDNPGAVVAGVEGVRASVLNRMASKGITDQNTIDTIVKEEVGSVHASVIDTARAAGSIQYANDYLKAHKKDMTPDQVAAVEAKLKPATSFAIGDEVGMQAFQMKQAGKSAVEIQQFINKNTKDPDARHAAEAAIAKYEQAYKKDVDEKAGTVMGRFLDANATMAAYSDAVKTEEFLSLPESDRRQTQDYMLRFARATDREARAELEQSETEKSLLPENLDITAAYAQDPNLLADMSNQQLYRLIPIIGKPNVTKLFQWRDSFKSDNRRAKIEPALLKEVTTGMKKEEAARVTAYAQSALMDWKVDHPGEVPDEDTQRELARAGLEIWVESGSMWGTNEKERAKLQDEPYEAGKGAYPRSFAEHPRFAGYGHKDLVRIYNEFDKVFMPALKAHAAKHGLRLPNLSERIELFYNKQVEAERQKATARGK